MTVRKVWGRYWLKGLMVVVGEAIPLAVAGKDTQDVVASHLASQSDGARDPLTHHTRRYHIHAPHMPLPHSRTTHAAITLTLTGPLCWRLQQDRYHRGLPTSNLD